MTQSYDHIVVGAGAIGAATAYWLAESGARSVLVLEQFELGHGRGASEDHSRIIRHAYHSPVYTALTPAAYETWAHLEELTGLQLVLRTGGLDLATAGTPGEVELGNYHRSLPAGVTSERLDAREIRARWPQWAVEDDVIALYQEDGGILDIRRSVAAHIALARRLGVTFRPRTPVEAIATNASGVTLRTRDGDYSAGSVALCVASWLPRLLASLGLRWNISLSQEQVSYFATPNVRDFLPDRFPMWIWHGDPLFYGFPVYGEVAVKAARDMTGRFITSETRSYDPIEAETALVAAFLERRLPGALGPELYSKTCVYDLPADRDFVVDRIPGYPQICAVLGAGHAGKFASLIGRILADLTLTGTTSYPIDAFRADRPALTDPDFVPVFRLGG